MGTLMDRLGEDSDAVKNATSTGFIESGRGTLVNMTFDAPAEYADGTRLQLKGEWVPIDGSFETSEGYEGVLVSWNVGDAELWDWDGGVISNVKNEKTGPNNKSGMGKLIASLLVAPGGDVIEDRFNDHGPQSLKFWEGLQVELDTEVRTFTIDGEKHESRTYLVVEVIGVEGEGKKAGAKKAGKKTAAKKAAPAEEEVEEVEEAAEEAPTEIPADLVKALDDIADGSESHDEFMELAYASDLFEGLDPEVADLVSADLENEEGDLWMRAIERAS